MSAPADDVADLIEKLITALGPGADLVDERTLTIEWGDSLLRITVDVVDDDGHLLP